MTADMQKTKVVVSSEKTKQELPLVVSTAVKAGPGITRGCP